MEDADRHGLPVRGGAFTLGVAGHSGGGEHFGCVVQAGWGNVAGCIFSGATLVTVGPLADNAAAQTEPAIRRLSVAALSPSSIAN